MTQHPRGEMEEIPEDVRETAKAAFRAFSPLEDAFDAFNTALIVEAIARAIMAERGRRSPTIIRDEIAGFYEVKTQDSPALYSGRILTNIERVGDKRGDLIGFRVWDQDMPDSPETAIADHRLLAGLKQ